MYPEHVRLTPNASRGQNERLGVCFHHTGGSFGGAVSWLTNPASGVSAHVVIGFDGERCVLAGDHVITWHAGRSEFQGRRGCNAFLLGVEFELMEASDYLTHDQVESVIEWLEPRWHRYGWSLAWMTHHAAIAPGRKVDLSPANWSRLRTHLGAHFAAPKRIGAPYITPKPPEALQ